MSGTIKAVKVTSSYVILIPDLDLILTFQRMANIVNRLIKSL